MGISTELRDLVKGHPQGESLPGPLYADDSVFIHETSHFLTAQWLIVGHISQVARPGDYFTVDALRSAIVIVRGIDGSISAFHNVCRHRGARICEARSGHAALLRCRYHGWTYKLSGELAAWRHMPEELERGAYGLRRCAVTIFEGLILVSLDPGRAPDPEVLLSPVRAYWQRYDLARCKVAAERIYPVRANWKLCIENNLECYHCLANHPQYTAVHAFVRADERTSQAAAESFAAYKREWKSQMDAGGVSTGRSEMTTVGGQVSRAGTWPLAPGKLTTSRDGSALAPLLGRVSAYDESVTTGCVGFLSYVMAACDYAIVVSYLPQSARTTEVVIRWLVHEDAVEGKDYDVEKLCFIWDETTKQDKDLIELNAAGVTTAGYVPGPYSKLESLVTDFVERYLTLMRGSL